MYLLKLDTYEKMTCPGELLKVATNISSSQKITCQNVVFLRALCMCTPVNMVYYIFTLQKFYLNPYASNYPALE